MTYIECENYFRTFSVIFFGPNSEPPGLIGPLSYHSFGADNGGLVASGDGTDGALKEAFRNAEPGPGKNCPPVAAGGDMAREEEPATPGGLLAEATGGDAAEIGPLSVLNSAQRGHFLFVFM